MLDAINTLRESQVRIIFKQEELDTLTLRNSLLISTIEVCTQAENETRSANIKWSIKKRAKNLREIYSKTYQSLKKTFKASDGSFEIDDFEIFENVAYIMAYHADKSILGNINDRNKYF